MAETLIISKPKLLIVEGEDEKGFFEALLTSMAITDVQVLPIGGKTKLRSNLKALVQGSNFSSVKTLAVARDADDNPTGAFQSVCDALKYVGLSVPAAELILSKGNPKTIVMILPAPGSNGMLEDVCLSSVASTREMSCVLQYFKCIKEKTGNLPNNISKARLQTYLAAKEPGLRLGEAAQRGLWSWENSAFSRITEFIKML